MIGDTLHDAEVARAMGTRCMLVARGHHSRETLLTAGVPVAATLMDRRRWPAARRAARASRARRPPRRAPAPRGTRAGGVDARPGEPALLACLLSALGCFLSLRAAGLPGDGRRALSLGRCCGRFHRWRACASCACATAAPWRASVSFGALFVLALALGYRLEAAGETGIDGLLLSLGAALCLGPAAGWAALWLDERMAALARFSPRPAFPGIRLPSACAPMTLMLLAWTPMLLAFYPGIHAYDTFSQLPDYLAGSFSTHHPLLHTLMTGWLYDLGGLLGSHALGMLFYSVAQMLLVAWALAYGLSYLARLGCRRWVRLGLLGAVLPAADLAARPGLHQGHPLRRAHHGVCGQAASGPAQSAAAALAPVGGGHGGGGRVHACSFATTRPTRWRCCCPLRRRWRAGARACA